MNTDSLQQLTAYGWTEAWQKSFNEFGEASLIPARVLAQHREEYDVVTGTNTIRAECMGKFYYQTDEPMDLPTVGDWVGIQVFDDRGFIHQVLPRQTSLSRRSPHTKSGLQIMAANLDTAFVVQSLDHNFNLNRLDRYLTIIQAGHVQPALILNKSDLLDASSLDELLNSLQAYENLPIFITSSESGDGLNQLKDYLQPTLTYGFLGSSGVGKSTLINQLGMTEQNAIKTARLSDKTNKGRHTTTHRQMYHLLNGSLVIDTPGMREIGLTDEGDIISSASDLIESLTKDCQFKDCQHENEPGCEVQLALENGTLDRRSYENYQKLLREQAHFSSTTLERKQKEKSFGKMVKGVVSHQKKIRGDL